MHWNRISMMFVFYRELFSSVFTQQALKITTQISAILFRPTQCNYRPDFSPHPYIADVAVDWINSKLFAVDRDGRKIVEYDLKTGTEREVLKTGEKSKPNSITAYPFPGAGSVKTALNIGIQ